MKGDPVPAPPDRVPGRKILAHRTRAGLSQTAFGHLLGVERGTISNWERGRTTPTPQHLERLLELLATPPEQLIAPAAPAPAVSAVERARMQRCADLVLEVGEQLYLLELKSSSCADAGAVQRRIVAALKQTGIRVFREHPNDGEGGDEMDILLSDN